ncbi:MAG: hypothetical protein K1000chlam4_00607 [Chlamydiae bacterium]|nr:hypothetical protein [Chlamydiota bacterium]
MSAVDKTNIPPGFTPEAWEELEKSPLIKNMKSRRPSATSRLLERSRARCPEIVEKSSLKHYRWSYLKEGGKNGTTVEKLRFQTKQAVESKDEKCFSEIAFAPEHLRFDVFEQNPKENVAAVTVIGGKTINEDAFCTETIKFKGTTGHFFGVFDGHGDRGRCAGFVADALPSCIKELLSKAEKLNETIITDAITQAIGQLEKKWDGEGGTTATCALKIEDHIYLINVGDSRTILVKKESVYSLTEDANPKENRFERAVKKMGSFIVSNPEGTIHKVLGMCSVARDIGMEFLSAQPKLALLSAGKAEGKDLPEEGVLFYREGDYLVLASDGLWNDATTQEVGKAIQWMDSKGATPNQMALALVQETQDLRLGAHGGVDNVTVMVVKL